MSRHSAPARSHRIGDRLTVTAVHLILNRPMPAATDAGQNGRHAR